MNKHCGRWVFSKNRGCLMVVAEAAKGQGKGGGARGERSRAPVGGASGTVRLVNTLALSAMLTQSLLQPLQAVAQIRADNTAPGAQRPTVLSTGSGLPQVNITTPSAAGVSRNRLSQMDVDSRGAVVNNSRTHTPTQIGGWVQGNPWLATGEARVILLEVNSQNPSHINGFIEIAGQRSEIIVANPAGLTVNGSGFINASRATLTTGEVNVHDAGVSGYTVRGGTITIGSQGFDASLTDYTGILARAVAINGPVRANQLTVVTGANQIEADGQGAAPTAGSGPAPSFALDVSQLGGMYAGKITLLATEAGVGVRNAGGVQAGSGGLSLSTNGDLVNQGSLASQGSASLNSSGRFDNSGSLSAAAALNVQSTGSVTNSGQIRSGGALTLQTAADLANSGQIGAGTEAALVAGGRLDNTGGMSAGTHLSLQGAQLSNAGSLNAGQLLTLNSAGRFDNEGEIVVQGSVQLVAPQGMANTGSIQSQKDITLTTGAEVVNSGSVVADGALAVQAGTTVTNTGSLMGDQGVSIQNPQVIENRGHILSGAQTTLSATDHIDNHGLIVGDGGMQLESGQRIHNHSDAQIYAGGDLQASAGQAILNEGRIGADGDIRLETRAADGHILSTAGSVLSAGMDPAGAVPLGKGSLSLHGGSVGAIDLKGLTLAGQSIQAQAGSLTLNGQDLLTQRIDLQASQGDLLAQGSSLQAVQQLRLDAAGELRTDNATLGATQLDVTASEWNLQGSQLQQVGTDDQDARIQVGQRIDASGATLAVNAGSLTLSSQALQLDHTTLTHSGTGALVLQSQGPQTVVADDALLSTGGSLQLDAAALQASRSLISSQTDAQLNVQGAMTATEATLVANGTLDLRAGSLSADKADLVGVDGGANLTIAGAASLREGSVQSRANIGISAQSLDSTQGLISGQDISIDTHGGALGNADGAILAAQHLNIASGTIDNQRGVLQGGGNASIAASGAVNNRGGQILAGGTLALSSSGTVDSSSASGVRATIAANTGLSITSQGLINQGSDIKSAAALQIDADTGAVDNSQAGLIAASGALDLRGGALNNSQTAGTSQGIQAQSVDLNVHSLDNRNGALLGQNQLAVSASGSLDNTGGLLSSTGTLAITDPQAAANPAAKTLAVTNGAGGVIAANGATAIDARSLDNSGVIVNAGDGSDGSGELRIALSGALVNRAGGVVQAAASLSATAARASNAGPLEAANELHLAAGSIHNQATGAVRAGLIDLQASSLSNQGLVNGSFTLIQAGTVTNASGGRIYGDQISIAANQLNNQGGAGTDPVIASRGDLDLGVGVVSNTEGALLLSLGDTRVGGSLDANARATGSAGAFINSSAEVEVFGNLTINASSVQNVDAHGTSFERSTTEHIKEFLLLDEDHPKYLQPLSEATGEMDWRLEYDEQYMAHYLFDDGSPHVGGNLWRIDEYDRTITESGSSGRDPARISVGGNMTVNAGSTVNDKSSILIGGNFLLTGGSLQNIDGYRSRTVTEDNGISQLSYTERGWYDWSRHWRRFFSDAGERLSTQQTEYEAISAELGYHTNPNHGSARPQDAQAVSVASLASAPTAPTAAGLNGTPGDVLGQPGPGVVVRTLPAGLGSGGHVMGAGATAASSVNAPPISLPSNALFQVRFGAPAGYLVETDPEFTLQRRWLGSDYMLTQLGHDPATQTQRLGDGFYEQKLVREQVAQLTGRRFLGSFTDDEAQYRALLEAGVAFAKTYQLKPGIALTGAQMALLTSDIVWLVERTVQLPDGRSQRVLVPQLYALVDRKTGTLQAGLISAKGTTINLSGGLFNSGTLAARDNLAINAGSITNVLGQMQGNNVDLRARGGITSILGDIAARQNLNMKAGGGMVFVGGGIKAGGNARLSAGGDLLLLAYDTGKQVRAQSKRDENGNLIGKGPVWSYENSTYNQTGVDIDVGGSLSARAGGNLVAQGVNANVGGSTNLSAGQDMQLTTALRGHVNSFEFYNKYKSAGDLLKISQRINSRDIDLKNSGNSWSSGGDVSLKAGGNLSLVGAQIKANSYSASAGGSYQERAAYDVKENVHIETTKRSGLGVYLADATNNTLAITTLGEQGGKTEKDRTETHIDSTRTAIVTDINAEAGAVNRNAGGDVLIEGSIIRGGEGLVDPVRAGGKVTAVAAVDTRHVEDSTFTSTIRWQSTKSKGSIEQTLHMPEIHGLPTNMSAYQGVGGVSVQLPAGSNVRTAIETLSQKPGQGYLKELGNRSDIDWLRVEELKKSLDFSKSGLTQEATIVVIIVVSILTYGAASGWGASAASGANLTATA
ncbi:MAG: filamentous hemagglutinin N-terminal domain-containing protein, partial [Thiobacillus sp.]|nr:filamentous hemagglutinin N-terminal domain-containing protein [Thiobacillus sp.]